jgi:esterase/lipase
MQPPASRLPRLRGHNDELKEMLATKKFAGWAFSYGFWDFIEGRSVSEVDVEGVSHNVKMVHQVLNQNLEGPCLGDRLHLLHQAT